MECIAVGRGIVSERLCGDYDGTVSYCGDDDGGGGLCDAVTYVVE